MDHPPPESPEHPPLTDAAILELGRQFREGSASHASARITCIITLGLAGPNPLVTPELVVQARQWCSDFLLAQIEREISRVALEMGRAH